MATDYDPHDLNTNVSLRWGLNPVRPNGYIAVKQHALPKTPTTNHVFVLEIFYEPQNTYLHYEVRYVQVHTGKENEELLICKGHLDTYGPDQIKQAQKICELVAEFYFQPGTWKPNEPTFPTISSL